MFLAEPSTSPPGILFLLIVSPGISRLLQAFYQISKDICLLLYASS
jgi:hypothetical protein